MNQLAAQRGVALVFVLIIIVSLSLLLPRGSRQIAQGYDFAALSLHRSGVEAWRLLSYRPVKLF